MINDAVYVQEGVPAYLLGLHWTAWSRDSIHTILRHYGICREPGTPKLNLLQRLNRLIRERGLTRDDRLQFFSAYRNGFILPPRKHQIVQRTGTVQKVRKIQAVQHTGAKLRIGCVTSDTRGSILSD